MMEVLFFLSFFTLVFFIYRAYKKMSVILKKIKVQLEKEHKSYRYRDFSYSNEIMPESFRVSELRILLEEALYKDEDSEELKVLIAEFIEKNIVFFKTLRLIIPLIIFGFFVHFF